MGTVPGPDRNSTIKHSKDGGNQRAPIPTQNERQCGIAATIATNRYLYIGKNKFRPGQSQRGRCDRAASGVARKVAALLEPVIKVRHAMLPSANDEHKGPPQKCASGSG